MTAWYSSLLVLLLFIAGAPGQSQSDQRSGHARAVPANPAISFPPEPTGAARCKGCHATEVEGYARSAMAHSLRRAADEPAGTVTTPDATIKMFSTPEGHWQSLQSGENENKYRVDYAIGSGNHASGYLVNVDNHLFQSPVAFYKSRNAYDLAPGYEKTKDPDFTRPVAEGCVFCHAGSELHVSGTDNQYRPPIFPAEAITCERCHGPSEKHLANPKAGTIVNPAKLEPAARDSICEQCHLLGVARVPNPAREFRDFQPGQKLESTFTTYHDASPPDAPAREFKVISHVEQLAMSVCARSSQGKLWCGTCHDPHNKPLAPTQYYRSRCLSCHAAAFPKLPHPSAQTNCISCHMPPRDAQDGGHTAFTDHRIQRRPHPQSDLPAAGDIAAWREPAPDLQKRNLGIAYLNAGFQRRSSDFIVHGYRLLTEVQSQFASDPEIFTWMGTALLLGKKSSEAQLAFERAAQLSPNSAAAETNIAVALQQEGDMTGTITHLERAVAIDPLHLSATSLLIDLYRQEGNAGKANELSDRVSELMKNQPGFSPVRTGPSMEVASSNSKVAGDVFKNVKVLKEVPSHQMIPIMRFIASSLGVECSFCHVEGHFEEDSKPQKETARKMMRMMSAINQNSFDGTRQVTCYSCHRGASKPSAMPLIANEPVISPNGNSLSPETVPMESVKLSSDLPTAEQVIGNFVRALGGALAIEQITSRFEKGSIRAGGKSIPVEVLTKAPDKQLFTQHTQTGDRVTTVNGDGGWTVVPGRSPHEMSAAELDAARIDADFQFALHFQQIFPELRSEYSETVNGREAYIVVGIREGQPPWKFFFDAQSGLLLRIMRYSETPLGRDPTQIDYDDYRAVDGVQIPYRWTVTTAESESTIQIEEVQQNIPIDDEKFIAPSAATQEKAK